MSEIKKFPLLDCAMLAPLLDRSTFAEGTFGWFKTLAQTTLAAGEDAIVVAALDEAGAIRAALPLAAQRTGNLRALTAPYTTRYTPLLADTNWAKRLGLAAGSYIQTTLRFDALDASDPGMAAFLTGLESSPLPSARFAHFLNWHDHIADFDRYWRERPGQLKSTVERKLSSLSKKHTLQFECATEREKIDQALATYEEVYNSSWKPVEPYPSFIGVMAQTLCEYRSVRLATLKIDGIAVAAQIWLVAGDKATIFKLAHSRNTGQFSPGTLLTHWMLSRLCREENVREVDFGRGGDSYKRDWLSCSSQRTGLIIANWKSAAGCSTLLREVLPTRLSNMAHAISNRFKGHPD
jgi:hypothetical protein